MANIIIKSDERLNAEAATLHEFGIAQKYATIEQREYAEQITASEKDLKKEFKRMEKLSTNENHS